MQQLQTHKEKCINECAAKIAILEVSNDGSMLPSIYQVMSDWCRENPIIIEPKTSHKTDGTLNQPEYKNPEYFVNMSMQKCIKQLVPMFITKIKEEHRQKSLAELMVLEPLSFEEFVREITLLTYLTKTSEKHTELKKAVRFTHTWLKYACNRWFLNDFSDKGICLQPNGAKDGGKSSIYDPVVEFFGELINVNTANITTLTGSFPPLRYGGQGLLHIPECDITKEIWKRQTNQENLKTVIAGEGYFSNEKGQTPVQFSRKETPVMLVTANQKFIGLAEDDVRNGAFEIADIKYALRQDTTNPYNYNSKIKGDKESQINARRLPFRRLIRTIIALLNSEITDARFIDFDNNNSRQQIELESNGMVKHYSNMAKFLDSEAFEYTSHTTDNGSGWVSKAISHSSVTISADAMHRKKLRAKFNTYLPAKSGKFFRDFFEHLVGTEFVSINDDGKYVIKNTLIDWLTEQYEQEDVSFNGKTYYTFAEVQELIINNFMKPDPKPSTEPDPKPTSEFDDWLEEIVNQEAPEQPIKNVACSIYCPDVNGEYEVLNDLKSMTPTGTNKTPISDDNVLMNKFLYEFEPERKGGLDSVSRADLINKIQGMSWRITNSGSCENGSIHFIVKIPYNCSSKEEYKYTWLKIAEQLNLPDGSFDKQCSNPSRKTRRPDVKNSKTGRTQHCISYNKSLLGVDYRKEYAAVKQQEEIRNTVKRITNPFRSTNESTAESIMEKRWSVFYDPNARNNSIRQWACSVYAICSNEGISITSNDLFQFATQNTDLPSSEVQQCCRGV